MITPTHTMRFQRMPEPSINRQGLRIVGPIFRLSITKNDSGISTNFEGTADHWREMFDAMSGVFTGTKHAREEWVEIL